MSEIIDFQEPELLDEDLYFILDDDNIVIETYNESTGFGLCPESVWSTFEPTVPLEIEEPVSPRQKKKKKKKGARSAGSSRDKPLIGNPLSALKVFAGFPEDINDDEGSLPHAACFKPTEFQDTPTLISKLRDYRRFRYYDLIRAKLELHDKTEDIERIEGSESVLFDAHVDVREFKKGDVLRTKKSITQPQRKPSILFVNRSKDDLHEKSKFTFKNEPHSPDLRSILQETQDKFTWETPSSCGDLQHVMSIASKQACAATENVLCAFEGVSSMGKYLVGVINRLQGSTTRYLVLNDSRSTLNEADLGVHGQRLVECILICEQLRRDIAVFKNVVSESEEHMASNSRHISTSMRSAIQCSRKVKELFAAVYDQDRSRWHQLQAIININEGYTRCINFLSEMTPDRVFRFLKIDFVKMQADIKSIDKFCELLLEQTRMSLAESHIRTAESHDQEGFVNRGF